jgi:predicted membrane channel-forming protein YqfA (hemolysin III family)
VANLLVDRRRVRFDWAWGVAVALIFLANVQFWWSTFSVGEAEASNFFSFVFFLLSPIALYLAAVLILPDFEGESEIDLRAHFDANVRWFLGTIAVVPLVNALRSIFISHDPLWMPGRPYEITFFVLMSAGALIPSPRLHRVLTVLSAALFLTFLITAGLRPG